MNLPNAIERLRDVLRRQHKALSTESSDTNFRFLMADTSAARAPLK
jgi:hypothetical protein